jgi:hypothetical protein
VDCPLPVPIIFPRCLYTLLPRCLLDPRQLSEGVYPLRIETLTARASLLIFLTSGLPLAYPDAGLVRVSHCFAYLLLTPWLPLRFVTSSFQMLYKKGLYLLLTPCLPPHALKRRFPYLVATSCLPPLALLFTPVVTSWLPPGLPLALVVVGLWCPHAYPLFT